jgi:hypothetical protein
VLFGMYLGNPRQFPRMLSWLITTNLGIAVLALAMWGFWPQSIIQAELIKNCITPEAVGVVVVGVCVLVLDLFIAAVIWNNTIWLRNAYFRMWAMLSITLVIDSALFSGVRGVFEEIDYLGAFGSQSLCNVMVAFFTSHGVLQALSSTPHCKDVLDHVKTEHEMRDSIGTALARVMIIPRICLFMTASRVRSLFASQPRAFQLPEKTVMQNAEPNVIYSDAVATLERLNTELEKCYDELLRDHEGRWLAFGPKGFREFDDTYWGVRNKAEVRGYGISDIVICRMVPRPKVQRIGLLGEV